MRYAPARRRTPSEDTPTECEGQDDDEPATARTEPPPRRCLRIADAPEGMADRVLPDVCRGSARGGLPLRPRVPGSTGDAATGAWLGLFIGLVLGFLNPNPWGPLVAGVIAGVFFGLITSAIQYAMARGTRDFSSTMQLVAGRYDVLCDPQSAETGRDLLARLTI